MKKFFTLTLVLMFLFPVLVYAAGMIVRNPLKDEDGTDLAAYALTADTTIYSETITTPSRAIRAALLIKENKPSAAGNVRVSVEYSIDDITWFAAYTTSGGNVTVDADIYTEVRNTSRWVVYDPQFAPFIRYRFDPITDSSIYVSHTHQEILN